MRNVLLVLLTMAASVAGAETVIAVAPFEGTDTVAATREAGREYAEHVLTFLSQAPMLQVVERAQLDKLFGEIALSQSGALDESATLETGKMAGATHMVVGRFRTEGDELQVKARLVEIESGVVKGSAMQEGKDAGAVLDAVCIKLVEGLGITVTSNRAYRVKKVLGFTSVGLCVVLGGTAVWSHATYSSVDEEYRTSYNLSDGEYRGLRDEAELHYNMRWWMTGGSAVMLGVSLYLFLSNRAEYLFAAEDDEANVGIVPLLLPDGAGLAATVSF
jgi:TolB-like protein